MVYLKRTPPDTHSHDVVLLIHDLVYAMSYASRIFCQAELAEESRSLLCRAESNHLHFLTYMYYYCAGGPWRLLEPGLDPSSPMYELHIRRSLPVRGQSPDVFRSALV